MDAMEDGKLRFMGPESFCDVYDLNFQLNLPNNSNEKLYRIMKNHRGVPVILDRLKSFKKNLCSNPWVNLYNDRAELIIVFSKGRKRLFTSFPHYYNLMDTLALVRAGSIGKMLSRSDSWTADDINDAFSDPGEFALFYSNGLQKIEYLKNSYYELINMQKIKDFDIKNNYRQFENCFYYSRHSLALTRNLDITSFETWFNYIKSSSSAKLFDSTYFQYITDHLLNVPKFEGPQKILFPVDEIKARLVIEEMSRLIKLSLETIKTKNDQISSDKRTTLISRSVNVSVILTRFISRIDSLRNILSGSECAKSLARIYSLLIPFASFKTDYFLPEQEISRINLALAHICTVPIIYAFTFMDNVDLAISQKGLRRTLKQYHWFAARKGYILSGIGTSVADDQFTYGTSGSPLTPEETGFIKELMIAYFLPGLITDQKSNLIVSEFTFRYNFELYLVNIQNTDMGLDVFINLWTGATVYNGMCLINNSIFINSKTFRNFFAPEDLPLVSNGIAAEAAGKSIYAVPDFKGSSYLISREIKIDTVSHSRFDEIKINKKWNGNWYEWTAFEELRDYLQGISLEYDWIQYDARLFKRNFGLKSRELIIILKNEINPVMRFIIDETTSYMNVEVDGLSDRKVWTVITRKNTSSQFNYMFQRHFNSFIRGFYIFAIDQAGHFVIICMNLRFPEDMRRPIVFREKMIEGISVTEFEILNLPETKICSNQSLDGGSSLPGGLVIISDSKKALILPNAFKAEKQNITITVEKIPISDDNLAPQTREHKLLLAYYLILQFEFNSARKLLSPSSSIHHNEAFSAEEIKILKWITEIDLEAPEALALKLFAYLHSVFNRKKFIFDHIENSLLAIPVPSTYYYLYALREMSEKYYIFLIFPEVLEDSLFSKLFENSLKNNFIFPDQYRGYKLVSNSMFFRIPIFRDCYQIGSRSENLFIDLILSEKHDDTILASKLNLRRNHKKDYIDGPEMALICYLKEPELWANFKLKFLSLNRKLNEKERENIIYESKDIYVNLMENCIEKYQHLFTGIYQSSEMTMTSLKSLKATFEAETNRMRLNIVSQNPNQEQLYSLVSQVDIQTILGAKKNLRDHLDLGNENIISFIFNTEIMRNSSVLAKLQKSINDFVDEKAHSFQSEINLLDTLKGLETFFSDRINSLISAHGEDITELSTNLNANICSSAIGSILSLMHQKKAKTFESLYACYLKDSLVCIQNKFPQLTLEQCMEVKEKTKVFYSRQVLINYYEMLKERIESFLEFGDEFISADDLNIFCDELSKIYDFNERMKDPVIMNFEFRSRKYRLKPEQVEDVRLLTTADQNTNLFPSVVIQRMMAAGKTLVLGTISVVKKALDSKQLSILVPPSSLYQSNTTAMQARTYQYFKKKGINFKFQRFENSESNDSTDKLMSYLRTVRELITSTMNDNNYMILSPDVLHSFLNSYIEALLNAEKNWYMQYPGIIDSYANIYRIFKQRGSIILDEIDMTMDPKKELNFPTQETEKYNMTAVAMLTDIMEFMIFDEEIINSGLRIHSNNQASLTVSGYKKCIFLVLDYIRNQLKNPSSLWYYSVYGSKSNVTSVDNIMNFLSDPNMAGGKQWITSFHDSGNEVLADALIIVKHQLHCQMQHSLKGTVNLNFGSARSLRPEIKFAVPYSAANTPSIASVFADRWETLLKTLLMVSASSCSLEIAKDFIEYARIAIPSESSFTESIQTTATYQNLKLILPTDMCPISLDSKNILHVQVIRGSLSTRSPAAIRLLFAFYITQVFDKMTFHTEQISSNALNVTSMFNSVQGYSGTIDNVNILPQHVVKDAYEDNLKNEKNNGGIALKLIRDCNDGFVRELNEEAFTKSAEGMVMDLMSLYSSEDVSAIIDTGAFFKNYKNIEVARAILSSCKNFKAVLYYDEDSNQLEFLRLSNNLETCGTLETSDPEYIKKVTEVEIEERFTFYDQRHITGSDILQPKTAHAIMTVGPRVLLRDILQGALRMRQFMTSQKVHLVTTRATRMFYESKFKYDENNGIIGSMADPKIQNVKLKNDEIVEELMELSEFAESKELTEAKEVKEEVEEAIREIDNVEALKNVIEETTMKVSDVLTLGALNEDDKQEQENVKLAFGKINAEIRAFIIDEISRALVEQRFDNIMRQYVLDMIKCGKPLFLRSIKEVPLNWLQESKLENAREVLNLFAISQLHSLTKIMNKFDRNTEIQHRFNSMKKRIKDMISPANEKYFYAKEKILTHINLDEGTEVQQQTLTLTMVDLNTDMLYDNSYENGERFHTYNLMSKLKTYEKEEILQPSNDEYLSLKYLYHEKCPRKFFEPYLDNTLVTLGDRVGVTKDLIIISDFGYENYPIFSKKTFEGSHILVQLYESNVKVLLISSKHASNVLNELDPSSPNDFNPSKFWLCDLSGSVTATNDSETERGQNILDFIPKIDNLMFDLLAFNGSLPQILANDKLKAVYDNWLKSEYFENRAIFLRYRMNVLMSKDKEMFEIDDKNLGLLKKFSLGIKYDSGKFVDGYQKGAIEESFETKTIAMLNITSRSQLALDISQTASINFDFRSEVRQLFKIIGDEASTITPPPFIIEPESTVVLVENPNGEEIQEATREVTTEVTTAPRVEIKYAMSEEKVSKDADEVEKLIEILENEIEVDESLAEYQEPPLTELISESAKNSAGLESPEFSSFAYEYEDERREKNW